jgi:hypothetical protein
VVPDLVHQHVRDEVLERLVAAGDPFVEHRLAEQADAVGQAAEWSMLLRCSGVPS